MATIRQLYHFSRTNQGLSVSHSPRYIMTICGDIGICNQHLYIYLGKITGEKAKEEKRLFKMMLP